MISAILDTYIKFAGSKIIEFPCRKVICSIPRPMQWWHRAVSQEVILQICKSLSLSHFPFIKDKLTNTFLTVKWHTRTDFIETVNRKFMKLPKVLKGVKYLKLWGQVIMRRLLFCKKLGGQLPPLPPRHLCPCLTSVTY